MQTAAAAHCLLLLLLLSAALLPYSQLPGIRQSLQHCLQAATAAMRVFSNSASIPAPMPTQGTCG